MKFPRLGVTSRKVILLLLGGLALGFAANSRRQRFVFRSIQRAWKEIDRRELHRTIRRLYRSKLINLKHNSDGTSEVILSREGRRVAFCSKIDEMRINQPKQWDKKWRVVLFDIPEREKNLRDTLRLRLHQLGLCELQKSVFVHPYECRNEIDFIIELYDARRYVRFIEANHIDTELHLKKKFGILY